MDKRTNKKIKYNDEILISLQKKYGYSKDYIQKCIRGDRKGIMPDKIKKDYESLEKIAVEASKKAIEKSPIYNQ